MPAARYVEEARLRLSRSPSSEIAAAAYFAQQDAGLDAADFVVVAVEPGRGAEVAADVERAAGGSGETAADAAAGPADGGPVSAS